MRGESATGRVIVDGCLVEEERKEDYTLWPNRGVRLFRGLQPGNRNEKRRRKRYLVEGQGHAGEAADAGRQVSERRGQGTEGG